MLFARQAPRCRPRWLHPLASRSWLCPRAEDVEAGFGGIVGIGLVLAMSRRRLAFYRAVPAMTAGEDVGAASSAPAGVQVMPQLRAGAQLMIVKGAAVPGSRVPAC
jgi:hypothetical protein